MQTINNVQKSKSAQIARIALFVVLLMISAQLKIQFTAVAFTMQTAVLFLCGAILSPAQSAITASVYLASGLIGLPVFSEGGGITYALKPSFGYLIGFIPCASVISALLKTRQTYLNATISGITGLTALYAIGLPYSWIIMKYILEIPPGGINAALAIMPIYFLVDMLIIIVLSTAHKRLRTINRRLV